MLTLGHKIKKGLVSSIFLSVLFIGGLSVQAQNTPVDDAGYNLYSQVAEKLMCLCGCGSTIKGCPHKDCGFANPVKAEITNFIKQGQTKDQMMSYFVNKHGEKILTLPPKKGFNLVGYILPGVLVILVGFFISKVIMKWSAENRDDSSVMDETDEDELGDEDESGYQKRLENEIKDFEEY